MTAKAPKQNLPSFFHFRPTLYMYSSRFAEMVRVVQTGLPDVLLLLLSVFQQVLPVQSTITTSSTTTDLYLVSGSTETFTWSQASSWCTIEGGGSYLATVHNISDSQIIKGKGAFNCWIGLQFGDNGRWEWDGTNPQDTSQLKTKHSFFSLSLFMV